MKQSSTNGIWVSDTDFFSFEEAKLTRPKELRGVQATRRNSSKSGSLWSKIFGAIPNPDKVLKTRGKSIDFFGELRNDAHVAACIQSRKAGVMSLEWEINRGMPETPEAVFIRKIFDQLDVVRIIQDILEAPYFGYEILDIYWREEGGYFIPKDIVSKPREWFSFDGNNQLLFHSQENSDGEPTQYRKYLVIKHNDTYNNPYGEPILSRCFWPVHFKTNGLKFWLRFAEKYGMPLLYANISQNAADGAKEDILEMLDSFVQDSTAVFDEDVKVQLLEAARSSSSDLYMSLVNFANAEISKGILSHTGSTESTPGRLGNENSAEEVRGDIIHSDKRLVEKAMNQLIKWIIDINLDYKGELPYFSMYEQDQIEMGRVNRDSLLYAMGFRPTPEYFKKYHGYQDNEFNVSEGEPAALPFAQKEEPHDHKADTPLAITADQLAVDKAVRQLASDEKTSQAMDMMIAPLIKLINSGSSYEELTAALPKLFGKMDNTKIQEILFRAINAAETVGRIGAGMEAQENE